MAKFSKEEVLYDIANLSDGVLATLSGFTKYSDLSKLQNALYDFVEGASRYQQFDTWMDAWNAYIDSGKFTPLWAIEPAIITWRGLDWVIEPHEDQSKYFDFFWMSPVGAEDEKSLYHVREFSDPPYRNKKLYKDVLEWQKGKLNINGKSY